MKNTKLSKYWDTLQSSYWFLPFYPERIGQHSPRQVGEISVIFVPKYHRKMMFLELRQYLGSVFHELALQKEWQIIQHHKEKHHKEKRKVAQKEPKIDSIV
ncbi:MAG: hypothetical protein HC780_19970 [Leptolyngbyaceae cyanobacterium CSU_1_3]|nr:hypothetical protein [Leptolyngbyaceae cyanobacterium CSU_1_3]